MKNQNSDRLGGLRYTADFCGAAADSRVWIARNMGIGKRAAASGEAIVDRVLCVAGAVAFSQAPEFMQQYLQRLGGSLDEARHIVGKYEDAAQQAGKPLADYIAQISASPDTAAAPLGGVMENAVERMNDLAAAQAALQDATVFQRPFAFFAHIDAHIAKNTWLAFKPAVPTTIEGLIYALIGIVVILAVYYGCVRAPVAYCWRKYKEGKAAKVAAAG